MKAPIFVFGSGRCGSTLLQRALNLHESVVLYGEHQGFLGPLSKSFDILWSSPDIDKYVYGDLAVNPEILWGRLEQQDVDICWANDFSRDDVLDAYRSMVLAILARRLDLEKVHWGFKEIRYTGGHNTIKFLMQLFPDARFVVLSRNPAETVASGILAWDQFQSVAENRQALLTHCWERFIGWSSKYQYLLEQSELFPEQSVVLRYEDLVASPESAMARVFGLLDLEVPTDLEDTFSSRVADTSRDPRREEILAVLNEHQVLCKHTPFRAICQRFGYPHLSLSALG